MEYWISEFKPFSAWLEDFWADPFPSANIILYLYILKHNSKLCLVYV